MAADKALSTASSIASCPASGAATTKGLGAGASPEVGKESAIESESEIKSYLEGLFGFNSAL